MAMNQRDSTYGSLATSLKYRLRLAAVLGITGALPLFPCHGAVNAALAQQILVTNIAGLSQIVLANHSQIILVQLEARVLWANTKSGQLILNDASGTDLLELDVECPMPKVGDRVRLQGNCAVTRTKDAIKLASVPVVDNDGVHPMKEESGSVSLKAGRHPIRVAWFNRTAAFGLEVYYEGPNVPRQRIPDGVLFRATGAAASGVTNFVSGLNYGCYEGLWWGVLPDFNHLPAAATGTVSNFDIGVRTRDEHVGLQFSGYIQVPEDGRYTFYTLSDDGSRVFIGAPSLQVLVVGRAPLPTAQPITTGPSQADSPEYLYREIEGTITSVNQLQDDLELELIVDSAPVLLKVAEYSDCSFAFVPHNRVRSTGVCRTIYRLDGSRTRGELFVQHCNDIRQRYITPELWALYPLATISDALARLDQIGTEPVVHLRGTIVSTGTGSPALLEDASGRIALETVEPDYIGRQDTEVLGRLGADGANPIVRCSLFRRVRAGSGQMDAGTVLTASEQVHQLSPEELDRAHPVRLRGVVTTVWRGESAVLQDATRGIFVTQTGPLQLQVGDYCEVEGVTGRGEFSPFITASRIRCLGSGALPNPVRATWDQLLNGGLHLQYVELEGVVVATDGNTITLLTRDGRIKVGLESEGPVLPKSCQGALVRLRGCLFNSWDSKSKRVNVGSIYLNQEWANVVQPAPTDPFALPTKKVDELLKFDPQAGAFHRVKVSGQIIYQGNAGCFLMDGDNGLRFSPAGAITQQVGDLVEVVGFPEVSGPSPVLQEAIVRQLGSAELPKPRKLGMEDLVRDEYDSTLVQVVGVLLGSTWQPDGVVLNMQTGLRRFVAVVQDKTGLDSSIKAGSRLELTGVYVGQGGSRVLGRPIDSFQLWLNSGAGVHILSLPPWWTLKRLLAVVGLLLGVLMVALIWIRLLHRRVAERTLELEAQIQRRQYVERQHEIERERARVAHDLHDDLGAQLTEVNMLSSLVKSTAASVDERDRYLDELSKTAERMVTSLDEIVWAVNPRNDSTASLAGYFCSYAQQFLALASVSCGLDVAEDLPDCPLNPKCRQELFRAFKEALTNVVRHSAATKVWLHISVLNDTLIVAVTDDGQGIEPGRREAGADGLANMQERLSELGGSCEIQSERGKGTTVRFQVPLSRALI
jgi:signal transduction histidine kinase